MDPFILLVVSAGLILLVVASAVGMAVRRRNDPAATVPAPAEAESTPAGLAGHVTRASQSLGGALRGVFSRREMDAAFWESMEEALIGADLGHLAAAEVVARVRQERPATTVEARAGLRAQLISELAGRYRELALGERKPALILVVGVNGTGKTTTIAKLAKRLQEDGRVPLLGAADTFRAAADAQLRAWGDRLDVDVVGGQEGSDPASVAFDGYTAARARGRDAVIVDTAGRLQAKHNLMAELTKIRRVLEREAGGIDEVLLVLDATGGQNGLAQAEEFSKAVDVTGIVLTKLDGTARGGIVVAIERTLGVPVKFAGVGEGVDDLVEFDPVEFVDALLSDA